ncbi:MAG: OmpA family protein [Proteobacteria bacterium]|nr:OmpA family protein [Pseudomonadota bacterium]
MTGRAACLLALILWAAPLAALDLVMPPGARLIADRSLPFDSYDLPLDGFSEGRVRTRSFEGQKLRQSWRIDSASVTTLQLLAPLRAQLDAAGYETVHECESVTCGGFDFRFAVEVIPSPDMYVDIRDYRFLSAVQGDAAVGLLVSRSRTGGYIQIIEISPEDTPRLTPRPVVGGDVPTAPGNGLAEALLAQGHVVLDDLVFATGTVALSDRRYASLSDLGAFLRQNPSARIALVGHTDMTGALETNISVSRQRAEAVRDRLVTFHGIEAGRMVLEGLGPLAPRDTNLTAEGRDRNRRVEAVLLTLD